MTYNNVHLQASVAGPSVTAEALQTSVAGLSVIPESQRHAWGRNAKLIRLFEGAALVCEAGLVFITGLMASTLADISGLPAVPSHQTAVALVYVILLYLCNGFFEPPFKKRRPAAIRALFFAFLLSLPFTANVLQTLPQTTIWFFAAGAAICVWRWMAVKIVEAIPGFSWPTKPAAFIGNSEAGYRCFETILHDPQRRTTVVGFFDDRADRSGPLTDKLPHLGGIDDLIEYIHNNELNDIYMALPWTAGERISILLDRLRFLPMTVHLIPDHKLPVLPSGRPDEMQGVVMPTLMRPPFSQLGRILKRGIDVSGSIVLLIPLIPVFLITAAAIKLDNPGPIFFTQRRIGQYGRSFSILKFRTLTVAGTDQQAEELVGQGDKRVTRVGAFLRKYSVDELPQIINVLFGDMSLIGPRPHAPRAKADQRIYAEIMPDYMLRYRVKPGMTGWAQVNGWRGNTDTEEKLRKRVQYDFDYITNWSLFQDIRILFMTLPSAIFPPKDNV